MRDVSDVTSDVSNSDVTTASDKRFKVGMTRYPEKRYQQALSFNPYLFPVIIARVGRRLEALRLARSKLGQFKVDGTSDWFLCDEDVIVETIETVINETKA